MVICLTLHQDCAKTDRFPIALDRPNLITQFMWANFLRSRVPLLLSSPGDVEAYVHKGVAHALSPDALAAGLPGAAPLSEASCARMDAMAALGKEPHQNS